MTQSLSSNVWQCLSCPFCGHELHASPTGAVCSNCHEEYGYSRSGALDLRLRRPKKYPLELELGTPLETDPGFQFSALAMNPVAEVDYAHSAIPRHLTREILSYFPKARSSNSLMLDLGCGGGIHKEVCEQAGYEWVGLDYDSEGAQILGDAQSLPFQDATFEFVLCVTVLQYIRYPFVMTREVHRVLKPGGRLVGTVAFLEPSHGTSFYHHTHLGTYNSLHSAGFRVERLAPSERWSVLKALANMGLFYRMPDPLAEAIVLPLQWLHELWWRVGAWATHKPLRDVRLRNFTGSFTFIASKSSP
ncbi:MAG: class I SAM-dependent methyltransferase [Anaerolineae bacterium]